MTTPAIMLQGTGSNVGKSLLAAGLCRALTNRGLRVAPFKPQNMSNNAAVTEDGGEIGRAQALQALACRLAPGVHMNPVLLKPASEQGAQLVVQGRVEGHVRARDFGRHKAQLLPRILDSFARLGAGRDLVVVEGAGSPAETNLRKGDVANMGFAEAADVPVLLVGDIDRGGVIAQIVGTRAVLGELDAARIKGFIVNKFRGHKQLFDEGVRDIERRTGWSGLGVLPFFEAAHRLPAEDALDIASAGEGALHIAVPMLSRISNFDDLDPLKLEPSVRLTMTPPGAALPGDADLVILPGSKSTLADLAFLRQQGWDIDLQAHLRRGGHVFGLCGGYQMLGRTIGDPHEVEGGGDREGLGLLDIETVMQPVKTVRLSEARHVASGALVSGYEIHMGESEGPDRARPLFEIDGRPEGARSSCGRISGSYLHGCFSSDGFRAAFVAGFGQTASGLGYKQAVDETLDALAAHIETHLDVDAILRITRTARSGEDARKAEGSPPSSGPSGHLLPKEKGNCPLPQG